MVFVLLIIIILGGVLLAVLDVYKTLEAPKTLLRFLVPHPAPENDSTIPTSTHSTQPTQQKSEEVAAPSAATRHHPEPDAHMVAGTGTEQEEDMTSNLAWRAQDILRRLNVEERQDEPGRPSPQLTPTDTESTPAAAEPSLPEPVCLDAAPSPLEPIAPPRDPPGVDVESTPADSELLPRSRGDNEEVDTNRATHGSPSTRWEPVLRARSRGNHITWRPYQPLKKQRKWMYGWSIVGAAGLLVAVGLWWVMPDARPFFSRPVEGVSSRLLASVAALLPDVLSGDKPAALPGQAVPPNPPNATISLVAEPEVLQTRPEQGQEAAQVAPADSARSQEEYTQVMQQLSAARDSLSTAHSELSVARDELSSIKTSAEVEQQQLAGQLEQRDAKIADLQASLQAATDQQYTLDDTRTDLLEVQAELEAARQAQTHLQEQYNEALLALSVARDELTHLRSQAQTELETSRQAQAELLEARAKLETAQQAQAELSQVRVEFEAAQAANIKLRTQHDARRGELAGVRSELQDVHRELVATQQLQAEHEARSRPTANLQKLHEQVAQRLQAASQDTAVTLRIAPDQLTIGLETVALFNPDRILLNDKGRQLLNQIAPVLRAHPDYDIRIEGHAAEVEPGKLSKIWQLEALRAASAAVYLTSQRIDSKRFGTIGSFYHRFPTSTGDPSRKSDRQRLEISVYKASAAAVQ